MVEAAASPVRGLALVGLLLCSASLWMLCLQQFFRAAAMAFFQQWLPTFLRESRHLSISEAGLFSSCAAGGAFLGGLLGGFCSDWLLTRTGNRWLSRQGIAVFGMLSCALLIVAAYYAADRYLAIACITLGAFIATFGGVSGYTVAIELGGRHVATVFSVMNTSGNIGAALFPWLVGVVVDRAGNWDSILFLCAGVFVVDGLCWAMLRVRGPIGGPDFITPARDQRTGS